MANSHAHNNTGIFEFSVEPIQEFSVGSRAELMCTLEAAPIPTLTWFKLTGSGAQVQLDNQVPEDPDYGVYVIESIIPDDGGDYRCRAATTLTGESKDFEVIVLGKYSSYFLSVTYNMQCMYHT